MSGIVVEPENEGPTEAAAEVTRILPALSYLLAKWGATMPYRRAAPLLSEFLPLSDRSISLFMKVEHGGVFGEYETKM